MMQEQYIGNKKDNDIPEWLYKAQRRLKHMCPNERLDEELFCLSSWLSLSHYERNARKKVIKDFNNVISELNLKLSISTVGSYEFDLMLPTSDINILVNSSELNSVSQIHQCIINHFLNSHYFKIKSSDANCVYCVHLSTGIDLSMFISDHEEPSFSQYIKHVKDTPKFSQLYLCVKYYLSQMQKTVIPMQVVIPLSIIYVLTVVAKQDEKQYLGRLFLKYLEYFGKNESFQEIGPYSFIRFYNEICKQCHLQFNLPPSELNRVFGTFCRVCSHGYQTLAPLVINNTCEDCLLPHIYRNMPRLTEQMRSSMYFYSKPSPSKHIANASSECIVFEEETRLLPMTKQLVILLLVCLLALVVTIMYVK